MATSTVREACACSPPWPEEKRPMACAGSRMSTWQLVSVRLCATAWAAAKKALAQKHCKSNARVKARSLQPSGPTQEERTVRCQG